MIETNLAFANTTLLFENSYLKIIKNLDHLFKMFSQRVKHHKSTPEISQTEI